MYSYQLRLGLPHTNYNHLTEYLLMMAAGNLHWDSISQKIGIPLSAMRTAQGGKVYSTFFYIETRFPESAPIDRFVLDDDLCFGNFVRSFKNMAVEGQLIFDRPGKIDFASIQTLDRPPPDLVQKHPFIHFGNVFISPEGSNSSLKVAPPFNADFSKFRNLPNEENTHHITRAVAKSGTFGMFEAPTWRNISSCSGYRVPYAINPDRDSNGAGLVYFANYFAFMDFADRKAMSESSKRDFLRSEIDSRALRHRKTCYLGNVNLDSSIAVEVDIFEDEARPEQIGFRYKIFRQSDQALICLSEAIKVLAR